MKRCSVIVGIFVIVGFVLDGSICEGSKKYNRYLAHIFNKYGSGGTMSFEGLEHLMHSLGLGGLEFNPTHTIEEHHPDGYKIPDVTLDEDIQQNKDLQTIESINQHVEVKELEQDNRDKTGKTLQDPSEIDNDDDDDGNILPVQQSDELGFKEMHDPKHRHPRHHADPVSSNNCLSPQSLLKLVIDNDGAENINKNNYMINNRQDRSKRYANEQPRTDEEEYNEIVNNIKITPITFLKMCPALLVQIDQDACAQPIISEHHDINVQGYGYAWIYASIAIFIISCCGLLGVAIVPLAKSVAYDEILKFLVAIAVGTLCGDALMHLMPHALIKEHDNAATSTVPEGHNNEPVWLCACAFLTALFMYSLETLLPLIKGENGHNHGHSHHHGKKDNPTSIDMEIIPKQLDAKEINIMLNETETDKKSVALSPVAFMVILGDGLHNITDGLAIGAAFAGDPVTGMATAFAVLCHELPHELGDFALLLQTGVHIKRALFLNIVSSVLSFMGMAAGLIVAGVHTDMVRWIYAGTAGSFLYIALADLIPEMGRDGNRSFKNCLIQISGILLGGVIMMLIALNEENLRILFE